MDKNLYDIAYKEYCNLPEVMIDSLDMPESIEHMVFRAQHEIDLVDEGERDYNGESVSKSDYKKIVKYIKKWTGK
jgi:hypothetical protein